MQITKVNIPEDKTVGLDNIKMPKLGKVVIIAGQNGSGKSRLLRQIRSKASKKLKKSLHDQITNSINNDKEIIKKYEAAAEKDQNLDVNKINYGAAKERLANNVNTLNKECIETSEYSEKYPIIDFVPTGLNLKDCNLYNKNQLITQASNLDNVGVGGIEDTTLAKIQVVQDQWFNATHPETDISDAKRKQIIKEYGRLKSYIKNFLDTDLGRNENGDATIFGFKLGGAKLSNGQKVLLQFCLAIYSQGSKLNELIIFLDEPENHLHPKALIEVIDKLVNAQDNGQIWIATHSINLLAHFDPSMIWYMKAGEIKYAGKIPDDVLKGLIGEEKEISKLNDFLALPAQMASISFAVECLFQPKAVLTGSDDPQTNQIIKAINNLRKKQEVIKILDLGAGKGRLLSTISALSESNESIREWLDYYAYDTQDIDKAICKNTISEVYGEDKDRYFNDEEVLCTKTDFNSFNLIVMCNVFHEIDPKEWLELFGENGVIRTCLKNDGFLLIVEDQLLAKGEKAYHNGFMVFDKKQFKHLFKMNGDYKHLEEKDGRLKAHYIPAQSLCNVSSESRLKSIKDLDHTARKQIKQLREQEPSYIKGRLHGFWTQQLANTQLVLGELETV